LGDFVKKWFEKQIDDITNNIIEKQDTKYISKALCENLDYFKAQLGSAFDVKYRSVTISGVDFSFVMVDGLCDNMLITEQILKPILKADFKGVKDDKVVFVASDTVSASIDKSSTNDLDKAIRELVSGNLVMLVDGCEFATLFGVQAFAKRLPQEPSVENQERGSREGFVENFKDNVAMVRRRIRSAVFKADLMEIGSTSKTRVCVCYMSDRISEETLNDVKKRLKTAQLDTILGSGYLQPFLDHKRWSIFTCVGMTQRPDVFSAKLGEGKIGIIIDGSPDALFVPYLFVEHFQSLDDYLKRPYYATFIRILKMISLLCSVFLAGLYVAICTFHQEMIPESMVFGITSQESKTPLPIVAEALLIHLIYEIVREAGLRMPKPVGHAVSIVGALVIGESAVSAGIIAAPMLIVVGLTAVSSFVVSTLMSQWRFCDLHLL
jgi:spore germination protein KA